MDKIIVGVWRHFNTGIMNMGWDMSIVDGLKFACKAMKLDVSINCRPTW